MSGSPIMMVIGAGQAGAMAAAALRSNGFGGRVLLIGEEPHPPYERPPLSKDALLRPDDARCAIFAGDFYERQDIDLRLGTRVRAIDPDAHTATLSTGETLAFDKLLLATGARVRRLPLLDELGADVHTLRTLDDARRLSRVLRPGRRILLVGGGVIGMEVAASATELGAQVTVIEQAPRLMARCAPAILSEHLAELHRSRGVVVHVGAALLGAGRSGAEIVLTLRDGTRVTGDAVVYGIGVEPETSLAAEAGLETDNGILVDENCRTSHPDIYAAGDAARRRDAASGEYLRRETWENANEQAAAAARAMLGMASAGTIVPWFWTDQCGVNFQFAGDMAAPQWAVRGKLAEPPCMLFGLRDGRLAGAVAIDQGRDMRSAKELISTKATIAASVLEDPQQSLRDLAKTAAGQKARTGTGRH